MDNNQIVEFDLDQHLQNYHSSTSPLIASIESNPLPSPTSSCAANLTNLSVSPNLDEITPTSAQGMLDLIAASMKTPPRVVGHASHDLADDSPLPLSKSQIFSAPLSFPNRDGRFSTADGLLSSGLSTPSFDPSYTSLSSSVFHGPSYSVAAPLEEFSGFSPPSPAADDVMEAHIGHLAAAMKAVDTKFQSASTSPFTPDASFDYPRYDATVNQFLQTGVLPSDIASGVPDRPATPKPTLNPQQRLAWDSSFSSLEHFQSQFALDGNPDTPPPSLPRYGRLDTPESFYMPLSLAEPHAVRYPSDLRWDCRDRNIFVFHLPSEWGDDDLYQTFCVYGEIECLRVVTRPDGSSKGYGFVLYKSSDAALQAIDRMDGQYVGSKRLKVSFKKTPEECSVMPKNQLVQVFPEPILDGVQNGDVYERRDDTIFVFHLPSTWEDNDLVTECQRHGTVLRSHIARKVDGSSKGYGFATFEHAAHAKIAIAAMNGKEVGRNKRLKVQIKNPPSSAVHAPGSTIFIFHLPQDWTEDDVIHHFRRFGRISWLTVQRDKIGHSRGFGFVSYDMQKSALKAIAAMDKYPVGNKRLKVSLKRGEERFVAPWALAAAGDGRAQGEDFWPLAGGDLARSGWRQPLFVGTPLGLSLDADEVLQTTEEENDNIYF